MCDSRQISWTSLAPQRRDNWLHLTMRLYEEASQELALAIRLKVNDKASPVG
jgi:hypothetical protein